MAQYAITGIWKDDNDTITDYAIHLVTEHLNPNLLTVWRAEKYSKKDAINLVQNNFVQTAIWDYTQQLWILKAKVKVVGNYLRSESDDTVRDNLDNLLNYRNITIECK